MSSYLYNLVSLLYSLKTNPHVTTDLHRVCFSIVEKEGFTPYSVCLINRGFQAFNLLCAMK